jgi:hypothetical protein
MNKEIKIRKDTVRITGRVDVVTKLMAEGNEYGGLERIFVCMDVWTSHSGYVYTTLTNHSSFT